MQPLGTRLKSEKKIFEQRSLNEGKVTRIIQAGLKKKVLKRPKIKFDIIGRLGPQLFNLHLLLLAQVTCQLF